jgi:hypothetical protein
MADWTKTKIYAPRYQKAGVNQHGFRYKQKGSVGLDCCRIEAKTTDTDGLRLLILLSHNLNAPVHYDFDANPQKAYIEVVSAETVIKELT